MIVRWGLAELPGILDELSVSRPLLVSTERWRDVQPPVHDRFHGVLTHAEIAGVTAARESVRTPPAAVVADNTNESKENRNGKDRHERVRHARRGHPGPRR